MQNKYKDKGVVMLALSQEPKAVVSEFSRRSGINYIVGAEARTAIRSYRVRAYPTVVVFDSQGREVYHGHDPHAAEAVVEKAVRENGQAKAASTG